MSKRFLLDTNVISRTAPAGGAATFLTPGLHQWMRDNVDALFLSCITVAEIRAGVAALDRKGASAKAHALNKWLEAILEFYGRRVLPLDVEVAMATGSLIDRAKALGGNASFEDSAIAATAQIAGMTVVTANAKHFQAFGVPFITPPA